METTIKCFLGLGFRIQGLEEMEKKMETTIMGLYRDYYKD